jgi:antitoxin PrlF
MSYSVATSKGQVTIPKAVRDRMGIKEGTRLIFVDDGDRILVYKVDDDLASVYGAVKHEGPPIDFHELKERMAEDVAREAVARLTPSQLGPEKGASKKQTAAKKSRGTNKGVRGRDTSAAKK